MAARSTCTPLIALLSSVVYPDRKATRMATEQDDRMTVIERWVTVCPEHGVSYTAHSKPPTGGCYFWSTDDVHCREAVEVVRLTNTTGAVSLLDAAAEWIEDAWSEDPAAMKLVAEIKALSTTTGGQ